MKYAYERIAEDMLQRIRQGEWKEGEQLPAISALEHLYPQSRMTLYKALCHLAERGYLVMARGRGTFVKAVQTRPRIGVLASSAFFKGGVSPFTFQTFRHTHAYFTGCGMDSQLYAEDPLSPSGLPSGLHEELDRRKLTGLLTISAKFPSRHMLTSEWHAHAIPHVHIGYASAPYRVYVDLLAFFESATALARERGHRRVLLLEKEEHLADHLAAFTQCSTDSGLTVCSYPSMPPASLPYEDYGYNLMHRIWETGARPDAVIIPDDIIAKGVAQAILACGIRVPEEMEIIAMTNRGARIFYPVPMISLEIDVESMVAYAAKMLIDQINGVQVPPQQILIPSTLPATCSAAVRTSHTASPHHV